MKIGKKVLTPEEEEEEELKAAEMAAYLATKQLLSGNLPQENKPEAQPQPQPQVHSPILNLHGIKANPLNNHFSGRDSGGGREGSRHSEWPLSRLW